jgi:hypothetical protein
LFTVFQWKWYNKKNDGDKKNKRTMVIERRKAKRIKKHLMIQYQVPNGRGHWDATEMKDFSEKGLMISGAKAFEINTMLRLRIKLPLNPFQWHELYGKVVTCEKDVADLYPGSKITFYLVRIEIIKIEPETKDMIQQYLAWCLREGGDTYIPDTN